MNTVFGLNVTRNGRAYQMHLTDQVTLNAVEERENDTK